MNESLSEDSMKMYPYAYIHQGKRTILVWQTNGKDTFRLDPEGRLISAPTVEELKHQIGEDARRVAWAEGAEINFDRFWVSLRNMRPVRSSSEQTCHLLLNGWNFLEDLGRTFRSDKELEGLRSPLLSKAYEKLFYGNNLPSMTPKGHSYHPLWTAEDMQAFRTEFRKVWQVFREKGIFQGTPSGRGVKMPLST